MANGNNIFNTGDPEFDAPAVLHDIKEWIEQQQLNPTPLTALQIRAIADLRRSFEPDLGQNDWVSMLNLLRQSRGMPAPEYLDEPSTTDEGRWVCHCLFRPRFSAEALVFPSPVAGYVPGPAADGALVAPAFARKKDAKQYAARCCYEAVTRQASNNAVAAAQATVASKTVTAPGTTNAAPAATAAVAAAAAAAAPKPTPTPQATTTKTTTKPTPTSKQQAIPALLALARKLGLPIPQITAVPSAGPADQAAGSFFDAHIEFGSGVGGGGVGGGVDLPADVGRVSGVFGKRNAREAVAEQAYEWLLREEGRRMGEVEELLLLRGGNGVQVKREEEEE